MSIECIQHLENSYQLKQKLAIEQEEKGDNNSAIYYYVEAISRLELLCTSYHAYLKIGINLHMQYIETNLVLAKLYKREDQKEKYLALVLKTNTYIKKLESILSDNYSIINHLKKYKEILAH
ncbi:MAG: hypothetical protein ACRCVU_02625 [Flavobacterium sp.]